MTLREILHTKGHVVHTIGSNATLDDVVQTLVRHNCGSLVVCDDDSLRAHGGHHHRARHPAGLRRAQGRAGRRLRVADAMTTDVVIGSPNDSVEDTMGLMTDKRIRHLPVVEDGQLWAWFRSATS